MPDVREAIRGEPVVLDKAWAVQVEAADLYKALSKLLSSLDEKTARERAEELIYAIAKRVAELVDRWRDICVEDEYVSPSKTHACRVAKRVIERIDKLLARNTTLRLMLAIYSRHVVDRGDTSSVERLVALLTGTPETLSTLYDALLSRIEALYNDAGSYAERARLAILAQRLAQILSRYAEGNDSLTSILGDVASRAKRLEDTLMNDISATASKIVSVLDEAERKLNEVLGYGNLSGLDKDVSKKCGGG